MDKLYEIFSEPISKWLNQFGIEISKELVFIILIISGFLLSYLTKKTIAHIKNTYTQKNSKSLHPFFNNDEIHKASRNYINQNFQNIAPSKEDEFTYTHSSVAKQKLIQFFLNSFSDKSDKRFFIILADSGMGKTTFSLNLYRKYHSFLRLLINKNKYEITLIPLGYDNADFHINELKKDNSHLKTILILDALDEDSNAIINSNKRIKDIIELTKEFRFVIVTCRTQFFNNENLEPNATNIPKLGTKKGYYYFEKLYLSPFTNEDVNKFINRKYGLLKYFHPKKRKAKEIIINSPYLMARPMLLDFIDDIIDAKKDFNYTFNVYEALIDSWLERETYTVSQNKKFTYKNDLLKFSNEIAKKIYNSRKQLGYTISQTGFDEIARKNNLDLTSFEMKVRSLLNRNPEGDYKFSHKSILEFFLAKEIYRDESFKKQFDEEGMDMTMNFYDELCYMNNYSQFVSSGKLKTKLKLYNGDKLVENILSKSDVLKVTQIVLDNFHENDLRAIRCFKNIKQLYIKNSDIGTLEDINCFQNLLELKIQDSIVKEFRRISLLSSLGKLSLVNINLLDYQKNEVKWKELINLTSIDLSQNLITNIDGIEETKNMKSLTISNNKISKITLPGRLDNLNLSNNPLKEIDFGYHNNAKFLNLANCDLNNKLVEKIESCSNLIELDVSENGVSDLSEIGCLNKLKKLNISKTSIKKIELKDFPNLPKEIIISKKIEIEDDIFNSFKLDGNGNLIKLVK